MIGRTLGPYRIDATLGEGGMGTVYRGTDPLLDRAIAIKVLRADLAGDPVLAARFQQEARILATLTHPNIATLYGLFQAEDRLFMAMEFVDGETLAASLTRRGRLPWREACALTADLLRGLESAHRCGVVHRDLKPANLLIARDGALKITDFGIARIAGSARHTRTGVVVGTPAYMAPELITGEPGDERSDLYAAGMVLYELLTGEVAFDESSDYALMRAVVEQPLTPVRTVVGDLPPWLDDVVMKALAKNAGNRYQTASAFLSALESPVPATRLAVALSPVLSRQPTAPRLSWRHAVVVASLVALVALVVASAVVARRVMTGTPDEITADTTATRPELPAAVAVIQPAPSSPATTPAPPPIVDPIDLPLPVRPAPVRRPIVPLPEPPAAPVEPVARLDDAYDRVRLLVTEQGKTRELNALLRLSGRELTVVAEKGGATLRTIRYTRLDSVIYSQSKHPRWKEGSAAAVAVGVFAAPVFFMKGTKHWLTLEGDGDAVVLQLDKRNYERLLPALESRSGKRVERRVGN